MIREPRITVDFETRSEFSVKDIGAWRYAEHPSTRILVLSVELLDGHIIRWHPNEPFPQQIVEAQQNRTLFEAHNVQFERAIWIHHLTHKCALPGRWADTMAVCAHRAIPLSLDEVGSVLDLDVKKDSRGKKLLSLLSVPQKPLKADKDLFKEIGLADPADWPLIWNDDPELLRELDEYCDQDVESESLLSRTIGDLPPQERRIWILDQKINQRGVAIDLPAVRAAIRLTKAQEPKLTRQLIEATGGAVQTANQNQKLKDFLAERGCILPNMQKATVESAVEDPDTPEDCRRVLEIRQLLARASTKKLQKILDCTSNDGRLRGLLQYAGAGRTNRWAGRLVQPQNLINTEHNVDALVAAIKSENADLIDMTFDDVPAAIAESLRGMFIAGPGKELLVADYSAIEARVLAWLAGEEWKLEVFRRGEPVYEKTAEGIFGYKITKKENPKERYVGKVCLGPSTPVVTSNGLKPLRSVSVEDKLWDGGQWVNHSGLIYQGTKSVIEVAGIWATPDHLMLTQKTWQPAQKLGSSESILKCALARGLAGWKQLRTSGEQGKFLCNAIAAETVTAFPYTVSDPDAPPSATSAPRNQRGKRVRNFGHTLTYVQTTNTAEGCSTELVQPKADAKTLTTVCTRTMGAAASKLVSIASESFCVTWSAFRDGMRPASKWIESTWTGITRRATCDFVAGPTTLQTNEKCTNYRRESLNSKKKMPVYDLTNAGPNSRFTIMTDRGPLIVSNCELAFGFQGGVGAWRNFDKSDRYDDDEVNYFKKMWRDRHPNIKAFWYSLEDAAVTALKTGKAISCGPVTYHAVRDEAGNWLTCRLPSGRLMYYYDPRLEWADSPIGKKWAVSYQGRDNNKNGAWGRVRTYGGKLCENITQAVARDFMAHGMLNVEKHGYPILLTVHDEIISEVNAGEKSLKEFEQLMADIPSWGKGCPVDAEGWRGDRYKKG